MGGSPLSRRTLPGTLKARLTPFQLVLSPALAPPVQASREPPELHPWTHLQLSASPGLGGEVGCRGHSSSSCPPLASGGRTPLLGLSRAVAWPVAGGSILGRCCCPQPGPGSHLALYSRLQPLPPANFIQTLPGHQDSSGPCLADDGAIASSQSTRSQAHGPLDPGSSPLPTPQEDSFGGAPREQTPGLMPLPAGTVQARSFTTAALLLSPPACFVQHIFLGPVVRAGVWGRGADVASRGALLLPCPPHPSWASAKGRNYFASLIIFCVT